MEAGFDDVRIASGQELFGLSGVQPASASFIPSPDRELRFGADGLCIAFRRDGPEARRVAAPDKRGVFALGANEHARKRGGGGADVTAVGANDSGEHEDS